MCIDWTDTLYSLSGPSLPTTLHCFWPTLTSLVAGKHIANLVFALANFETCKEETKALFGCLTNHGLGGHLTDQHLCERSPSLPIDSVKGHFHTTSQ